MSAVTLVYVMGIIYFLSLIRHEIKRIADNADRFYDEYRRK